MGTLGCINDMLQRDKENRELRKLGRDRMKETRHRLLGIGDSTKRPGMSVEVLEKIRRQTQEKEEADSKHLFKTKLLIVSCALFVVLLAWLIYVIVG